MGACPSGQAPKSDKMNVIVAWPVKGKFSIEQLEAQADEILRKFDFDRVHRVMTALSWIWWDDTEESGTSIPTVDRLRSVAGGHLRIAIDDAKKGKLHSELDGGGFRTTYDHEYGLSLAFVVTHVDGER